MYEYTKLVYARDITHSQHVLMDQMYMLKVISYGELQGVYRKE